ncbi:MAG: methylase [Candidatus Methanoliparum thermophilum]|uniref:Methylase n=1 Tax=Methanoliparum thermophilum TaxID=2491083 RepID=A0A520KT78_METT2|nr:HemK2/MTQ2 family protein methyltransferase [Candidatus Methanoliparum sp. LAM-1]RZN64950.1 MAG: methylase [Candidatus Methanoliparum thermophilum]BDC36168.1 protoporphyrinogen oxidase [Candidatus Methanoliparum sp. LAM-1]
MKEEDGYIYKPNDDTFILLDAALDEVKKTDIVLEIGTGCGVIAEALLKKAKCLVATDINPFATRVAKKKEINVIRTYLFDGIRGKFDLVLFNPPYLPDDAYNEEDKWFNLALIGGPTGQEIIKEFLDSIDKYLSNEGRFLIVISSLTGIEDIMDFAKSKGFYTEIVREKRIFFERIVVIKGIMKK